MGMNKCAGVLLRVAAVTMVAAIAGSGQIDPSRPTQEDLVRENLEQRMNTMRNLDALSRQEQAAAREGLKTRYYRPELTKDLKNRMEVPAGLIAAHGGSGVIKLIAQQDCGRFKSAAKIAGCFQENANIREYANAFSFRENSRVLYGRSDVALAKGHIVTGRHSVQTLIVALDGVSFESMTGEADEISYLFSFVPERTAKGMDSQFDEIRAGVTVANYSGGSMGPRLTYSKTAKIETGRVYAMRSIGYRSAAMSQTKKDADVVIVLKVLDTDGKGGATLLWKEISRKPGLVMKEDATETDEL